MTKSFPFDTFPGAEGPWPGSVVAFMRDGVVWLWTRGGLQPWGKAQAEGPPPAPSRHPRRIFLAASRKAA